MGMERVMVREKVYKKEKEVIFPHHLDPGEYRAWYYHSEGKFWSPSGSTFEVKSNRLKLKIKPQEPQVGNPITVCFENGPGNPDDWIGLFPEDEAKPEQRKLGCKDRACVPAR